MCRGLGLTPRISLRCIEVLVVGVTALVAWRVPGTTGGSSRLGKFDHSGDATERGAVSSAAAAEVAGMAIQVVTPERHSVHS